MNGKAKIALNSARNTMTLSTKDWSVDRASAWVYGILVGWEDDQLVELAQRHGWPDSEVLRLDGYHRALKKEMEG